MTSKNNKGMTLAELIIVLAIISIIGAVVVPNFVFTTDKARLKSDIQSARVIQNAIELYNSENKTAINISYSFDSIADELNSKGYLKIFPEDIQCDNAGWVYKNNYGEYSIVVDISRCKDSIKKDAYRKLTPQEAKWVAGGEPASDGQ